MTHDVISFRGRQFSHRRILIYRHFSVSCPLIAASYTAVIDFFKKYYRSVSCQSLWIITRSRSIFI